MILLSETYGIMIVGEKQEHVLQPEKFSVYRGFSRDVTAAKS